MKSPGTAGPSGILPNFLIVGAAKAGTTALYRLLGQHPDIFMPERKEPRYFSFAGETLDPANPIHKTTITNLDDYKALFADAGEAIARGEASPSYLHNPKAPDRIRELVPGVRLIAILRNPVDRAYSHFMHFVRAGLEETTDFREALADLDLPFQGNWCPRNDYLSFGFYGRQLSRYVEIFPRTQIRVVLYEDFRRDQQAVMRELFDFLGVDGNHRSNLVADVNVSGIPKSRMVQKWLKGPNSAKAAMAVLLPPALRKRIKARLLASNLSRPPLASDLRKKLIDTYHDDILVTERLIGRSLHEWLDT